MLIRATILSCMWCSCMPEALCFDNSYMNLPAFRGTGNYCVVTVRVHRAYSQYQLAWQYDIPLYTLGHKDSFFFFQLKKDQLDLKDFLRLGPMFYRNMAGLSLYHEVYKFEVHRAVHRNIISIVKPTRCTNVSNLFYIGMTLHRFRTVFPSIIGSSRLARLASRQQYLFDICLLPCVQSWTPDDGRKDRPKPVECHSYIK